MFNAEGNVHLESDHRRLLTHPSAEGAHLSLIHVLYVRADFKTSLEKFAIQYQSHACDSGTSRAHTLTTGMFVKL